VNWIHLAQNRFNGGACEYGNESSDSKSSGRIYWLAEGLLAFQ